MSEEGYIDFQLYRYDPSLPAAITSTVVFGILTGLHVWRLIKTRSLYFIPFAVGGVCCAVETCGYAARIASHFDRESIPAFSIQAIFILVGPALYAASIYMILGRIIISLRAEHLSLIPISWVTRIFVCGDIISFSLQAAGGGYQASGTLEAYETGETVIIAGLFIQIAVFGFFVVTSCLFHYRCLRSPTPTAAEEVIPWRTDLYVLYAVSAIILVRSVFRVIEYLQGNSGYLISHEIFLYVFDAILMAIVMIIFLIWYVDHLDKKKKRGKSHERLDSSEREMELGLRDATHK
ncbi:hypothetical protein S7711_05915 [Stachybotrys chartarum IBT 7711]|uniref:Protein RTA1 n=1 Tax=Stachybotrys chartarum (strain CBS 109288 / IBT 7711) TaxID=1280523 RepID=A0A084B195_STACB|nr:hypothetical protein S7711_05915 [Stachybotrys chartarum IBT 7711]